MDAVCSGNERRNILNSRFQISDCKFCVVDKKLHFYKKKQDVNDERKIMKELNLNYNNFDVRTNGILIYDSIQLIVIEEYRRQIKLKEKFKVQKITTYLIILN